MLVTVQQYAKSVQKSRITIYRWINEDRLPDGVGVEYICGRALINVGSQQKEVDNEEVKALKEELIKAIKRKESEDKRNGQGKPSPVHEGKRGDTSVQS